jgi:hypothetical protein
MQRKGTVLTKAVKFSDRVISLTQPWAWLVVNGFKPLENRCWPSKFTGTILIHSTKDSSDYDELAGDIYRKFGVPVPVKETVEFGALVGWAEFAAQVSASKSKWFTGPFAWPILSSGRFPQPCHKLRGYQRMWRTPKNLLIRV